MAALPEAVRGALSSALLRPLIRQPLPHRPTPIRHRPGFMPHPALPRIYAASGIAVGKDHPDELLYVDKLAHALGLPADQVAASAAGVVQA